jgi:archaellum biogenesis ATPase FlaH
LSNTDGSKKDEEVGYAVIWEEQAIKRKTHPQVIITDSLSTMMAVSDRKQTKNPKTQTIRKLMDQQGGKITLL